MSTFLLRPALRHVLAAALSAIFISVATGSAWAFNMANNAPEIELDLLSARQSVRITDREGNVLYRYFDEQDRENLAYEDIPQILKDAFVAIEDERFFSRTGCIDTRAVIRAATVNTLTDRTEGASTITQQLARSLFLTPDRTLERKIKEIKLACEMEMVLSKEEILAAYMNQVAYVGGAHGVERAAQLFFRKSARHVTLSEAAVLAAIPQRNGYYNPYGPNKQTAVAADAVKAMRDGTLHPHDLDPGDVKIGILSRVVQTPDGPVRIRGRAELVLEAMRKNNMIDDEQLEESAGALPSMNFFPVEHAITAPHFTLRVRDGLHSLLSNVTQPDAWLSQGLEIRTTIDPVIQDIAENAAALFSTTLEEAGAHDLAIVALDRSTRQILAYVGNPQFYDGETGQIDMASVPRQPGSSFKPIVYAALFENTDAGPDTFIDDTPLTIGTNKPKNYDGGFKGKMKIRDALSQSRNIPAIRAYQQVGGEDIVLNTARSMGVTTPLHYKEAQNNPSFTFGWPLAIGAAEVPLIEMVQAYATIAEEGAMSPVRDVCDITTDDGWAVDLPLIPSTQAISGDTARELSSILTDPESKPRGFWRSVLTIDGMTTGAKTGTSNLCLRRNENDTCKSYAVSNIWTIGYGPNIVVGVWAGNADGSALAHPLVDGLTEAAPIWRTVLEQAEKAYTGASRCS